MVLFLYKRRMEVQRAEQEFYIDIFLLLNFGMNFMLLDLTRRYFLFPLRPIRLAIAAAQGAFLALGVFFFSVPFLLELMIVIGVLAASVRVAFGKMDAARLIKVTVTLLVITMLAGGFCNLFYYRMGMGMGALIFCGFIAYVSIAVFLSWFLKRDREEGIYYSVVLHFMGESVLLKGLLDTGNCLVTPVGQKPVAIVEKRLIEGWFEKSIEGERNVFVIPFCSLGNPGGVLMGITIDFMELTNEQGSFFVKSPVLGLYENVLSREGRYQILLHPEMKRIRAI